MKTNRFLCTSMVATVTLLCAGAMAETLELNWFTIDGGGVTFSSGGSIEIGATTGQPDAGPTLAGGSLELTGGFWFEITTGDCNADGGVTLFDFGDFTECLTGPGGGLPDDSCACFDFDGDLDVDLVDWGTFQQSFNGS